MKFNDRPHSVHILFSLIQLCIFAVLSLSLVTIGKDVYSRIAGNLQQNNDLRMAASYTANKIRAYDYEGCVRLINDNGMDILSLAEQESGVNTYIYYYNGYLCEYQIFDGEDFQPERGEVLVELKSCKFTMTDNSVSFYVTGADGESTEVTVRLRTA